MFEGGGFDFLVFGDGGLLVLLSAGGDGALLVVMVIVWKKSTNIYLSLNF